MRKFFCVLMVLFLGLGLTACDTGDTASSGEKKLKVGIIQIVEHDALDASREGFLEALAENGFKEGENLVVDYQNAQNDMSNARTIAQKFATDKVDIVLAIGTQAAQAMTSTTKDIPILFTAVTDPVGAELVESMDSPGANVTGTSDMNPVKEQFELIKQIVPDAKTVGVLYDTGQKNSEVQVEIARKVAPGLGLKLREAIATNSSEVMQAAQSLVGKVDAIYVPTDNTVVSAIQSVVKVSEEAKLPVISGEALPVKNGALATIGIEYKELGRQTGEMALKIANGEDPATMPVETQKEISKIFNKRTAETIGIEIPKDLLEGAKIVE